MYCIFNGLLTKATGLIEVAYWDGAKDGATIAALVLVLAYLIFHPTPK